MNSSPANREDRRSLSDSGRGLPSECEWLRQSLFYNEHLAESEEISRHRWLESEKAGHDIGLDGARISWAVHHRGRWQKSRRDQGNPVASH
jgi:hypothetical protein